MTPALAVTGLTFDYPDGSRGLDGAELEIAPGERVGLLGQNGAGKTTLALHLIGVLRARAGEVTVTGLTLDDHTLARIRRRVGLTFQDPDDQLFMPTVGEDVAFGPANLGLRGDELDARVTAALDAVDLAGVQARAPHHLSGGERSRVAIATVLAMRPDVLVLDEPTAGLDPASRRELIEVVASLEVTVLAITHDLPFALELCPRSAIMSGGRIVADGPTPEILSDADLLAANRLELPYAFDPRAVAGAAEGRGVTCPGR